MKTLKFLLIIISTVGYYNIHAKVIIDEQYAINMISEIEVRSRITSLTDFAKVTIPRRYLVNGKLVSDITTILPDDRDVPIEIWTGYNGKLELEFAGYIDYYSPGRSLTIYCQDEMFKLKRGLIKKSFFNAKLGDILAQIAEGYEIDSPDIKIGNVAFKNMSPVEILQELRENYSIFSYFKSWENSKILHSGLPYDHIYNSWKLHLQKNVKSSKSLEYQKRNQSNFKIKAISNQLDGSKVTVEIPEESLERASTRTLNFGPLTKEELLQVASGELKRFSTSGFRGNIKLFGWPRVKPGDTLEIEDSAYNRSGKNLVDEVITRIKPIKYERVCKLGAAV